ncbi:lysophospholipid acyltransferase 5-like [Oppia nitens]|uniref:lysophospholipid acyltransferase 5-like n=1 Tax=Oppia nitens TaxID=1686743 RepID=UPI0023DA8214|nr:lysophospholipid acyltransferase 5-like [Oppia nitens]
MDYVITSIASQVRCDANALRLIISALLGYPICVIYNIYLSKSPIITKHIYYTLCGLFLCYYNYGINTIHSFVSCIFVWTVLTLIGPKRKAIALNLTFCMSYLLYGYYVTQTGSEYMFTWTIPQCVLTLRLIAMTFDVYDGHRNTKILAKLATDSPTYAKNSTKSDKLELFSEDTAVDNCPTLLQLLSHSYFPGSFLIGPQVKYKNYLKYIESNDNFLPKCWLPAMSRLMLGLIYLLIYQIGSIHWPYQYMNSPEFDSYGFFMRASVVAIIAKLTLCKYLSGWLIAEGVCIISGASYNEKTGSVYECSNVYVLKFETATTFGGLIRSFNLTTNEFAARYLFKRLKFLGSRIASHFLTLLFLALWHGWATGYYITFGMEFLIMKMEWEVLSLFNSWRNRNKTMDSLLSAFYIRWPLLVFFRIYTIYMFGYCLVPFILLSYTKWIPVLTQLYFCGHIIYGTWLLIPPLIVPYIKAKQQ